jgi:hypothetical protein
MNPSMGSRDTTSLDMGHKTNPFESYNTNIAVQHAVLPPANEESPGNSVEISTTESPSESEASHREEGRDAAGEEDLTDNICDRDLTDDEQPMSSHPSFPMQLSTKDISAGYEHYREWYQEDPPSAPLTPPSSSFGSSSSAPAPTHPLQNAGMFLPQPWMQPYAPHLPYAMPFMPAYPTYAMQNPVPQMYTSSASSDTSSRAPTTTTSTWAGMGGMYTVCSGSIG